MPLKASGQHEAISLLNIDHAYFPESQDREEVQVNIGAISTVTIVHQVAGVRASAVTTTHQPFGLLVSSLSVKCSDASCRFYFFMQRSMQAAGFDVCRVDMHWASSGA